MLHISKKTKRGNLILVLVMGTLGVMMAAVTSGLALNQLSQARHIEAKQRFAAAGNSLHALLFAELQDDPQLGEIGHPRRSELFAWSGPSQESAKLTFDPDVAAANGIEVSVNNIQGSTSVLSGSRRVPRGAILLRSNSQWNGQDAVVEMLVKTPPYPYAINSSGTLEVSGSAFIGQLPYGKDPNQYSLGDPATVDDLLPAHIQAGDDILLNGNIIIQGDAKSGGTITLRGSAEIRGNSQNSAGPQTFPRIDIGTLEPAPGTFETISSSLLDGSLSPLIGYHKYNTGAALLVTNGLRLNNGVLYVDGDLTVQGGIQGHGALIATGTLTVNGDSSMTETERVALVSGGRLHLQGNSSSKFLGTLYSNDDILIRNAVVAGTVIGASTHGSRVSVDNAIVAQMDGGVDLGIASRGFHRNTVNDPVHGRLDFVTDFGPGNFSYLEQAELLSGYRARVRWIAYHPRTGLHEPGFGEVDLATGTVISGDLDPDDRLQVARKVINLINTQSLPSGGNSEDLERTGYQFPLSPLHALTYINFFHANPANNYDWITDKIPTDPAKSTRDFKFNPNQFLAPGARLKVAYRSTRR